MFYKIRMAMPDPEYGQWTKDQVTEEPYNTGCDAFMYVSILWPDNGKSGMSVKFAGMDGRTGEPISDNERFKVWLLLASNLSESEELSPGKKWLCAAVVDRVKEALKP